MQGLRHPPKLITAVALLVGLGVLAGTLFTGRATAVHIGGAFELDGNVATDAVDPAPHDWDQVCKDATAGTATPLCLSAVGSSGADPRVFVSDGTGSTDDQPATGSTKADLDVDSWDCKTGVISPSKNDILHAFAAMYQVNGTQLLYFGLDRQNSDNGNATVGFWFFKGSHSCDPTVAGTNFIGKHAKGDILVDSEFTGGGGVSTIKVYSWCSDPATPDLKCGDKDGIVPPAPGGGDGPLQLIAVGSDCRFGGIPVNDLVCATVNVTADPDVAPPWPYAGAGTPSTVYEDGALFEGGINAGGLNLNLGCGGTFLGYTRSSQSVTAQMHDFALGQFVLCSAQVVTQVHNAAHTDITNTTVTGPLNVHDQATVSKLSGPANVPTPTGTVDFKRYATEDCTGASTDENNVALVNGVAESSVFNTGASTGLSYKVHYDGDANYPAADGVCEPLNIKLNPTVTTQIHNPSHVDITGTTVTGPLTVHDQATVTGADGTPTGTVDFKRYATEDCTGASVDQNNVALVNGVIESSTFATGTSTGLSYLVHYDGDANYNAADGICETLNIKLTPTVTTQIHNPAHVDITGTTVTGPLTVHDQATVTGAGPTPTGTVDFKRYATEDCTGASTDQNDVALVAGVIESSTFATGTSTGLSYLVHYDGDANYNAADGICETLNIKLNPTVTTQVHNAAHTDITNTTVTGPLTVHDQATVTGADGVPTGTVNFKRYATEDCTGASTDENNVALVAGVAESSGFATGTSTGLSYLVHYNGDGNYNAGDGVCEPLNIKLAPTVTTQVHNAAHTDITNTTVTGPLTVHDQATVTGADGVPTGTVNFKRYATEDCTGASTDENNVALVAGVAESSGFATGTSTGLSYLVHYNGDGNYNAGDGVCEPLNIKLNPTVTTQVHNPAHVDITNTTVTGPLTVHDQATVTGAGPTPTGTVDFKRYATEDCTGASVDQNNVALVNGVIESSDFATGTSTGLSYLVHYDGDANYNAADGVCEPLNITLPAVVTTQVHNAAHVDITNTTVTGPLTVHDQATVAPSGGGPTPTGTVDFKRYATEDCTGASVDQNNVALVNGVAESSDFATGTSLGLSYLVHYDGDANYNAADGICEPLNIKLNPTVTTQVHNPAHVDITNTTVTGPLTVHDQATVTGAGPTPSGTVDFKRYATEDCTGASVDQNNVALVNGVIESSTFATGTSTGLSYLVHYDGDANYNAADGVCEPLNIKLNTITSTDLHNANHSVITNGQAPAGATLPTIHDSATVTPVTNAGTPTGNVTFRFYNTQAACTADSGFVGGILKGTIALDGSGVAHPSDAAGPLSAGNYAYRARYNGSDIYNSSLSDCEPFTVTTLTIIKNAKGGNATFGFTVTGPSSSTPSITTTGTPNGTGQVVLVVLSGSYTVGETTIPSGWTFTGLNCNGVIGSNPTSAPFNIPAGTNATCTFENTAALTTRTQGFWATHMDLTNTVWFGGTIGGHTFPGVSDKTMCGQTLDLAKVLGAFWSNIAKQTDGDKRDSQDQAKMRLLQQLMAAILNNAAFGSAPSTVTIAQAKAIFCDPNATLTSINNAASAMAAFNESGDSGVFTPGVSANGKQAKDAANLIYWDNIP